MHDDLAVPSCGAHGDMWGRPSKRIRCEDGDTVLRESQKMASDPGHRRSRSQSSRLARLPGYATKLGSILYFKPLVRAISAELVVG